MTRRDYQAYLSSDYWKTRAKQIRRDRGFTCERCKGRGYQVHHKTYERLGSELDTDLELLCEKCHHAEHMPCMATIERQLQEFLRG